MMGKYMFCPVATRHVTRWFCSLRDEPVALRSLKPKSTQNKVKEFVDVRRVRAVAGKGGDGCVSFLQLWANETAGPDGGDGGNGGHVLIQACSNVRGLHHVRSVEKAESGEKGTSKDCYGKSAPHTIIKVPVGTVVKETGGKVLGDLSSEGIMFVLARGGAGGHGNKFFASPTQQSPEVAEYGGLGEDLAYILEVRSLAHFGLVGLPNAGKSSLLQAISRARPKVAPYPFTTLKPHLGIIPYSDYAQIAVADLPGLIEGSHQNKGLGVDFLRHVERCAAIVIVVDASLDPVQHVSLLRHELASFSKDLANKPQIIVVNKIDLPDAEENLLHLKNHLKDEEILAISAKYGTNITLFLQKLRTMYDKAVKNM